jgi:hypothetical protein
MPERAKGNTEARLAGQIMAKKAVKHAAQVTPNYLLLKPFVYFDSKQLAKIK